MKWPLPVLLPTPTPAPGDPAGQGHVYPTQGALSAPSCTPTLMKRNPSWSSLPSPSLCLENTLSRLPAGSGMSVPYKETQCSRVERDGTTRSCDRL